MRSFIQLTVTEYIDGNLELLGLYLGFLDDERRERAAVN